MAYLRRVNENNVDLNRNFLVPDDTYTGAAPGYRILHPLFNPPTPPAFDFLYPRLMYKLVRYGVRKLRQAGAQGQYSFPKGLFYGGAGLEAGPRLYLNWVQKQLNNARRVCAIDVHTGLGAKGDQLIILERNQGGGYHRHLEPIYGHQLDNTGRDQSIVYQVRGGIDYGVPLALPAKGEIDFVTQEFGTVNGFEILSCLRQENRLHHYGRPRLDHPAKLTIQRNFSPPEEGWRRAILNQGEKLIEDTVRYLF